MNTEEKPSNEPDSQKGNKKRARRRTGKRRGQRQRTCSGISNDDIDTSQNKEDVNENESNEMKAVDEKPTNKCGRGRKRKPTNEEKSENTREDVLQPPKQRKENENRIDQVVRNSQIQFYN